MKILCISRISKRKDSNHVSNVHLREQLHWILKSCGHPNWGSGPSYRHSLLRVCLQLLNDPLLHQINKYHTHVTPVKKRNLLDSEVMQPGQIHSVKLYTNYYLAPLLGSSPLNLMH